jgi:signal transduction histidine kinase
MLIAILILIFVITVASTWWFGLWSNLITLVNVLLSAMIATSFYENTSFELAVRLDSYALLFPFVSQWLLFAVSYIFLRAFTDVLSGVRLKFDHLTELIGRSLLSLAIAGVFVSFVCFTLQRAPLRQNLFSEKRGESAIGPEKLWISFVRGQSNGALSYTAEETMFFPAYKAVRTINGEEVPYLVRTFDPTESYIWAGADLRATIAGREGLSKKSSR